MKITQITVRKNTCENFRSRHIEATARVTRGESPEQALAKLEQWIEGQLFDTVVTVTEERVPRK